MREFWAIMAGFMVLGFLIPLPVEYATLAWLITGWSHQWLLMLLAIAEGLALGLYHQTRRWSRRRDQDAEEADALLQQLNQLMSWGHSLAQSLDSLGYRIGGQTTSAESVLQELARHYRVSGLEVVADTAASIQKDGGSLLPVIQWARQQITRDRQERFARQLEESSKQSTILILSLAPFGVLLLFRLILPPFYRAVVATSLGHAALILILTLQSLVWAFLILYLRKDGHR